MNKLIFLVLIVVLLYIVFMPGSTCPCGGNSPDKCTCHEGFKCGSCPCGGSEQNCSCREGFAGMKDVPYMEAIPKKDPKSDKKDYMEAVVNSTFGEGEKEAHKDYVRKRRNAGDHTLQLWGVIDGKRGYSTNFKGIRPPRQVKVDPTSAIQSDTLDLKDFVDPRNTRLI